MSESKLIPQSLTMFKQGYSRQTFIQDLTAGIIVGIVALPLAIAFAIASGVKPEQGLYTAIVAGFLISVLGGSRYQIGGPTGAFIVIVYGIVQQYGYDGLVVATLLAGVMLVIMGIARLGSFIKFIPYPVTVGFTSGIALIIASSQIKDFFGLGVDQVPAEFVQKFAMFATSIDTISYPALAVGIVSLATIIYWPRVTRRVPGSLIALVVATALVQFLNLPVETIGSRFGTVAASLPSLTLPVITWDRVVNLFMPALTIALLAGIESLLSAVVADGMTATRHRSNMEIVAQGIANIGSVLFGGIPATGAIARTATNIKNGGQTPVAGVIHAIVLLLIMMFFGRLAALIPMPALAAILLVVAYNMSEWRLFVKLLRSPRSDIAVMVITFALTVLVDLTVAIQTGVVMASFLFMSRMSQVTQAGYITSSLREEDDGEDDPNALNRREVPEGVEVFEIYGSFFFGAADKFKSAIGVVEKPPRVLILRMRHVFVLDATGLRALEDLFVKTRRENSQLVLSGVHAQPLVAMERSGLYEQIGEDNVCSHIDDALERARALLGLPAGSYPEPFVPSVARDKERIQGQA
jgi:SulP family sulfate permease